MSNIFLLPPNLDKKERFAASWEYLLENIPDLGQDFVDFLTQRSGKPSSTFVKSVSHPFFASSIEPDLLLECKDFDIICDHRLESQLNKLSLDSLFNFRFWILDFGLTLERNRTIPSRSSDFGF